MHTPSRHRLIMITAMLVGIGLLPAAAFASGHQSRSVSAITFLGEVAVPTGAEFGGTEIGGLSSITYNSATGVYHTISDDQGNRATGDPVRFYTVTVELDDGTLDDGDVEFTGVTTLYDVGRNPFAPGGLDPEGMALAPNGDLYVTSEGNIFADPIIDPFIRRYTPRGVLRRSLPIPDHYLPNGVDFGFRFNLGFESLNVTPNAEYLVTAGEGALFQDGPASTFDNGSLARLLVYNHRTSQPVAEYSYEVEPWAEPSSIFGVNGVVEVLPIDNAGTMLVMERSFSVGGTLGGGTGNVVTLYEASTVGATDTLDLPALYENGAYLAVTPSSKRVVFEFDDLGIPIDNIEGMTFGPRLEDGRHTVVIVSDNNFSATQFTQFIVLALELE